MELYYLCSFIKMHHPICIPLLLHKDPGLLHLGHPCRQISQPVNKMFEDEDYMGKGMSFPFLENNKCTKNVPNGCFLSLLLTAFKDTKDKSNTSSQSILNIRLRKVSWNIMYKNRKQHYASFLMWDQYKIK